MTKIKSYCQKWNLIQPFSFRFITQFIKPINDNTNSVVMEGTIVFTPYSNKKVSSQKMASVLIFCWKKKEKKNYELYNFKANYKLEARFRYFWWPIFDILKEVWKIYFSLELLLKIWKEWQYFIFYSHCPFDFVK